MVIFYTAKAINLWVVALVYDQLLFMFHPQKKFIIYVSVDNLIHLARYTW